MGKLILKDEWYNKTLTKAGVKEFNTIDITDKLIPYYISLGFRFLFEEKKSKKK